MTERLRILLTAFSFGASDNSKSLSSIKLTASSNRDNSLLISAQNSGSRDKERCFPLAVPFFGLFIVAQWCLGRAFSLKDRPPEGVGRR